MASLNASITSTGLISSGDASGNLDLQSNGTTGLSVRSGGKVVLANTALSTATAGTLEYDGGELYFTPLETQRGIIPGMQYYRLNSAYVGSNATGAQSLFGVGCTLSSNTVYHFEIEYVLAKTAGATSHTLAYGIGGTATLNNIMRITKRTGTSVTYPWATASATGFVTQAVDNTTAVAATGAIASASFVDVVSVRGTVSINAGGTFIPQYTLSAAPGGAYSTVIGSYILIYPIGSAGSNTSIGTWA
jgi:hypothetical protein